MMGKRGNRKKTRGGKEEAIRAEIRGQLMAGDERFLRVAMRVHECHPVSMEEAIALVMDEYRCKVQQGVMGRDWMPDQVRHDGKGMVV